jgi:hypothetical protein
MLCAALRTNRKDISNTIIILESNCLVNFVASSSNVTAAKYLVGKTLLSMVNHMVVVLKM